MDVGVVTNDANQMKTVGETGLPGLISTVDGIVRDLHAQWWGPDSDAFVHGWESSDKPNLGAIANEIANFGNLALANAQQQSAASNAN